MLTQKKGIVSSDQKLTLSYEILFHPMAKVRVRCIVSDSNTSRYYIGIAISIWPRSIILIFAFLSELVAVLISVGEGKWRPQKPSA